MNNRGSALMLVMIFTLIMQVTGMAVIYLNNMEEIASIEQVHRSRAFYMAEAGLERTKAWIQNSGQLPEKKSGTTSAFLPFGGEVVLEPEPASAQGSYIVSITPAAGNATSTAKYYVISSTGYAGNMMKSVSTTMLITNNMPYVYFSEYEGVSGSAQSSSEKMYFTALDSVKGLAHTNDQFSTLAFGMQGTTMTAVGGFNDYQTGSRPSNASYISMFDWNLDAARAAAKANGTLYAGLNLQIVLGKSGNRKRCTIGGAQYDVPSEGAVIFAENSLVTIRSEIVSGTTTPFEGMLTVISSGTGTGGKIGISNPIYAPDGLIGLVATNGINAAANAGDLRVDALMATTSTFMVNDWNTHSPPSILTLNGALVQKYRSPLGGGSNSEDAVTFDAGYVKNFTYNNRFKQELPPYMPGGLVYRTVNWTEMPLARRR